MKLFSVPSKVSYIIFLDSLPILMLHFWKPQQAIKRENCQFTIEHAKFHIYYEKLIDTILSHNISNLIVQIFGD